MSLVTNMFQSSTIVLRTGLIHRVVVRIIGEFLKSIYRAQNIIYFPLIAFLAFASPQISQEHSHGGIYYGCQILCIAVHCCRTIRQQSVFPPFGIDIAQYFSIYHLNLITADSRMEQKPTSPQSSTNYDFCDILSLWESFSFRNHRRALSAILSLMIKSIRHEIIPYMLAYKSAHQWINHIHVDAVSGIPSLRWWPTICQT